MKTLADEILGALTDSPKSLGLIAVELGAPTANVRRIAQSLNDAGAAMLVRRRRVLHLVSLAFGGLICKGCYVEFKRAPKSKRQCCSRTCGIAWSWTRPGVRERRLTGIKAERATPAAKARTAAHNERRWSKPGEREKLSEQNRRNWADPKISAKMSAGIRAVNGSPEMRKRYSDMRKADWQKPGYRERASASMREVKNRPEVKAAFSRNLKKRWADPKTRPAFMAAVKRNGQKAIDRLLGHKQTPEQIQRRVESFKKTMAAKRSAAEAII